MPTSAERAAKARRPHTSSNSQVTWLFLATGLSFVALVALGSFCALWAGDDSDPRAATALGTLTATPNASPTRDLAKRAGGLSEGAVGIPADRPTPPREELRSAGGLRFSLPLVAHAGIEDYFGSPRLYGLTHGGVDFSLIGLADVVVSATCNGTVLPTEPTDVHGVHVWIDCGDGWTTIAGFLDSATARPGQMVTANSPIGRGAPGGHVHFEIRYRDVPVNPEDYIDIPKRIVSTPTPTPLPTAVPSSTPSSTTSAATATRTTGSGTPTVAPAVPTAAPGQPTATNTATPTTTNTPTITPTPTRTLTPTRTPQPRPNTPTPPPISR